MNVNHSWPKRALSVVLAIFMVFTCIHQGALTRVYAAETEGVSVGSLIAESTTPIGAGYIAGEKTINYVKPDGDDNLISINETTKVIKAEAYTDDYGNTWNPTKVVISDTNGDPLEEGTLTSQTYTYATDAKAFSVQVTYELWIAETDAQKTIIANNNKLAAMIEMLKPVYDSEGNGATGLMAVRTAVSTDMDGAGNSIFDVLYAGVMNPIAGTTYNLGDEAINAATTLKNQVINNSGSLNLEFYNKSMNSDVVGKLLSDTASYKASLKATADLIMAIYNDNLVSGADATKVGNLLALYEICSADEWKNVATGLKKTADILYAAYNGENWETVSELLTEAGKSNTGSVSSNIAKVDLEAKDSLHVTDATVQYNMAMSDLTVTVVMNEVDENNALVPSTVSKTITLANGTTKAELQAAIDGSGFVADTLAGWAFYKDGQFDSEASALPETLEADTTYTVTYVPEAYSVTYEYDGTSEEFYYGYKLTLPAHANAEKSYDYVVTMNGTPKNQMQGDVIVVSADMTIARSEGAAYATQTLYNAIGTNAGANDKLAAILASGAIEGEVKDQELFFRYPDASIGENKDIIELANSILTAKADIPSSWNGKNWTAFTYGSTGAENAFTGNTGSWDKDSVNVVYKLDLSSLANTNNANAILALAAKLNDEAADQKAVMDALCSDSIYGNLTMLDSMMLKTLLPSVIDETAGLSDELKADFKTAVAKLADTIDESGYVKLYTTLTAYKEDGLAYYYCNYDLVLSQLHELSDILNEMLCDQEHLDGMHILMNQTVAGQDLSVYADKIPTLKTEIAEKLAMLKAPNAAIITTDADALADLADALSMTGKVTYAELTTAPYIESAPIYVAAAGNVAVKYVAQIVDAEGNVVNNQTKSVGTTLEKNALFTKADADKLTADLNAAIDELLGDNKAHYVETVVGTAPTVGTAIDANVTVTYNYVAKEYTASIEDGGSVVSTSAISIDARTVKLPALEGDGKFAYRYTYNGVEYAQGTTLTIAMAELGDVTITRETYNTYNEYLDKFVESLEDALGREGAFTVTYDASGDAESIEAQLADGELMSFVQGLVMGDTKYDAVYLGGELFYDQNTGLHLQALINAIMNDEGFTSQRMIALGENGKGLFLTTTMSLEKNGVMQHKDVEFTMYLTSVPEQMGTVASGLKSIEQYMTFRSNKGELLVELNLPEKVYELYLTALLATGYQDKASASDIDREIAYQFLVDYITVIAANEDITAEAWQNTLAKFGYDLDLAGYESYYRMLCGVLTNENLSVSENEVGLHLEASGEKAINKLVSLMGIDMEEYSAVMGLVYEYGEGRSLYVDTAAAMANKEKSYEALVLDVNASGIKNKFDYTENLSARAAEIAGDAVVILLSDVEGEVAFGKGRVILDLNGYTIKNNVSSSGSLYIVSSNLDTAKVGGVTGEVSGNVTIADGEYTDEISTFLKDGYKVVNGKVENALYTVESDGETAVFTINSDYLNEVDGYLPYAKALALDIAMDVVMNYFTAAALSADDNTLYTANFEELLGVYESSSTVDDILTMLVDMIDEAGVTGFANTVIEDLLDFGALADAVKNGAPVASYTIKHSPWMVTVDKADGNYVDISLTANKEIEKSLTVKVQFSGENKDKVVGILEELESIMPDASASVELTKISYSNKTVNLIGSGEATFEADLTKNENYPMVMGVILANGGSAQAEALIDAINKDDNEALKAAFDQVTVAEAIAALKALNLKTSFATIATANGVSVDTEDAGELEHLYHVVLTAMGKVLEKLEITGPDRKLGSWDTDEDGLYIFLDREEINRTGTASAEGYTLAYDLTVNYVLVSANIFAEDDCLWGDVNHDGKVTSTDAALVLRYEAGYVDDKFVCLKKADVNQDGRVTSTDAALILRYEAGYVDDKFAGNN